MADGSRADGSVVLGAIDGRGGGRRSGRSPPSDGWPLDGHRLEGEGTPTFDDIAVDPFAAFVTRVSD